MKKYIIPILLMVFLAGCSDDIVKDEPSIRGQTNTDGYFLTTDVAAHQNSDSTLTIYGEKGSKTITINLSSMSVGVDYVFGLDSINSATFKTGQGVYSTGTVGDGKVTIDKIGENTISGTFNFNAPITQGDSIVEGDSIVDSFNFNKGSFFDIPLVDEELGGDDNDSPIIDPEDPVSPACQLAQVQTQVAKVTYEDAQEDGSDEDIQEACLDYQEALENEINECGDDSGNLQDILDNLDCD